MRMLGVVTGLSIVGAGWLCRARVLGLNGQPVTQATFNTISYSVRDLTAALTVATLQPLTISQVVYNALQQSDPSWTQDSATQPGPDGLWGYNFAALLPASNFTAFDVTSATAAPTPNLVIPHKFQASITLNPVSGQPLVLVYASTPIPTWA